MMTICLNMEKLEFKSIVSFVLSVWWFFATVKWGKNSEILSININPPTRFGGWGFLRFTSSSLLSLTLSRTKRHATQEGRWELDFGKRNREKPVLFVVKMKISDAENQKRIIICFWRSLCLCLLYAPIKCNKNAYILTR